MRYKIQRIAAASLFLIIGAACFSQELTIGNRVPDFSSESVLNHTSASLKLSDINKKWILLDFWSTGCASCVTSFERMDGFQKKYDKDLQIVFINEQTLDSTISFFKKKTKVKKAGVPYITTDSALNLAFPHHGTPYYVLLDSNMRVVAFPEHEYISEKPMEDLIQRDKVNLGNQGRYFHLRPGQTVLDMLDSTRLPKPATYFIVTGWIEGFVANGFAIEENSSLPNRITLGNYSIERIFRSLIERFNGRSFSKGAVIVESDHRNKVVGPSDPIAYLEWERANTYCIDARVDPDKSGRLFSDLKEKLEQYFNLTFSVEKRKVPCLVLKQSVQKYDISLKSFPTKTDELSNGSYFQWVNKPFKSVFAVLKLYFDSRAVHKPFVDATGITGNVDMTIDKTFFDKFAKYNLDLVRDAVKPYGLEIVEEDYITDVIVIRDKK